VGLDNFQVILGHEVEVEEREIFGVRIFDRDELRQYISHHLAQLWSRLEEHEALEALKEHSIGSVLEVV
jgi:hypothetical protein